MTEKIGLADLHAHLTTSIHPSIYWRIAHSQGFKLPKKDYNEFLKYVSLSVNKKTTMKDYFDTIYHPLLNKLSSGTYAAEECVYEVISGAYRSSNIRLLELRTNPMKHNHEGQEDLDHIIMAMLRGMERALLEYRQVSAGIIFCLDRQFSFEKNKILVEKAIKYRKRGVIAIDFANYDKGTFHFKDYKALVDKAREAGLRVVAHCGETDDTNDMWEAIEFVKPERIGHGIKAAYDKSLMKELVKRDIILEICPLSNIVTSAVKDIDELRKIIRTFIENKVKFSINTDWPEIIENGKLTKQFEFLKQNMILNDKELEKCKSIALSSSFIPGKNLSAYL
ncbi:MAG: adenosine deaminase [Patescibacteria group bacterium]|nr:adenosine deaminase [Patescibacteria group bacterium]